LLDATSSGPTPLGVQLLKQSLAVAGAASALVLSGGAAASASTDTSGALQGGTTPQSATVSTKTVCAAGRHYCTTFTFKSVRGGVFIYSTRSAGYAAGRGCAREYVVVNGRHILPTNTVCYRLNTKITATHQINRKFTCGTVVGTDWVGQNAPQGTPKVRVTC